MRVSQQPSGGTAGLCKRVPGLLDFRAPALGGHGKDSARSLARRFAGLVSVFQRESTGMQDYERLKQLVEEAADDIAKAEGGNKAAGTRVRKIMQDIKAAAQEVRKKILEVRSSEQP